MLIKLKAATIAVGSQEKLNKQAKTNGAILW